MLRLGLDLGTNSIGWALFRLEDGEPVEIVDGGVMIHSDGRDPKTKASNAAERRSKRGPRRNRDRMLARQKRVAEKLHELGLLPTDEAEKAENQKLNPVQLRAEALDRTLEPYELGRVLLSFVDRRGFKSNRKADTGEDGDLRKAVIELRHRLDQSSSRTLGEYLWGRLQKGKPIRARIGNKEARGFFPDRQMVEDELEAIHKEQGGYHPDINNDDWDYIIKSILFQRPLRPVERGNCTLIPDKKRCFKAHPSFQRYRIVQEVNNIRVSPPDEPSRLLNQTEREKVIHLLLNNTKRDFDKILTEAGFDPVDTRINLRSQAREHLDGDLTAAVLRSNKCFGKKGWNALSHEERATLVEQLLEEEKEDILLDWLRDTYDLDEDHALAVANARLPASTGHLSLEAIERLLPHMENGMRYDEAVKAAGFGHHSDLRGDGGADKLPYYGEALPRLVVGANPNVKDDKSDAKRWGKVANPTVHIALGQVRRLFNAIVDAYGKPNEVVVELSRELKQNKEQKEADMKRQNENRKRNERLRELAANAGFTQLPYGDMQKLRLWEEQGTREPRLCPFTGEALSIERVLSSDTEIEHLFPYSRSLDNGMNNMVISIRSANREKGNKTPWEAFGHDKDRYRAIMARAAALPESKRWRFEEGAFERYQEKNDFLDRQLHENSYLSRMVREYLEAAVAPNCIWVTPGRLTADLRHQWALNRILSDDNRKNRDDHRHHLIDAIVIGLTSRSTLQQAAKNSSRRESGDRKFSVDPPWEGFFADVEAVVDKCIVRHRPDHFRPKKGTTTGSLHNETAYGIIDGPDDKGMMTLVETKPLDAMNPKKLDKVRDLALRDRLKCLWEHVSLEHSTESDKTQWQEFVKEAEKQYGVRKVRLELTLGESSITVMRDKSGHPYKTYQTDGNAYMDVWLLPSGKTVGETVTRFDAHQPNLCSEIKKDHPNAKKLMRLHIDDMIAVGEGDDREVMRVQLLSKQEIRAVGHEQGGKASSMDVYFKSASQVLQAGLRKVSVDVLGRVQDGGPFRFDDNE